LTAKIVNRAVFSKANFMNTKWDKPKSAIGNRGTFDSHSKNINEATIFLRDPVVLHNPTDYELFHFILNRKVRSARGVVTNSVYETSNGKIPAGVYVWDAYYYEQIIDKIWVMGGLMISSGSRLGSIRRKTIQTMVSDFVWY